MTASHYSRGVQLIANAMPIALGIEQNRSEGHD